MIFRAVLCVLTVSASLPAQFEFRESPSAVVISTPRYEMEIRRDGFGFGLKRGGNVILESAQPGDPVPNMSFERGGKRHAPEKLVSVEKRDDAVVLNYETTMSGATALIELRPKADRVSVFARMLHNEGDLPASVRIRLAPSGYWYGGGFQGWNDPQIFPINAAHLVKSGFLASGNTQGTPAWYATSGAGIWIRTPHDFPYSVNRKVNGQEDGLLSIEMTGSSVLAYDLLVGTNIRDIVDRINREIGLPKTTPPEDYFRFPIYTTWVEHKTAVSQEKVLEFARAIRKNDLPCGVLEIDDKWEAKYGDTTFDKAKFPDPKAMVDELHRMGMRVTLWVHPFVNTDSATFSDPRYRPLLLRDLTGQPGLMKWWQGIAAAWDFSNPAAADEFRSRLRRLQRDYGLDGFKFDGGDVNLLPRDLQSAGGMTAFQYPDVYNREAAAKFEWQETRVGTYSQPYGVVQRLIDKHSRWGKDNGLGALVPEAITVSMRGFFYLMPDMIGGNEYDGDAISKELLIRWAQASALMPLIQFSKGPWHFDEETVRLAREASRLHVQFAPYIIELAKAARRTGEPVLAPLWYHSPEDSEAARITDQFMVGKHVVVAPVLEQGKTARDIYLPAGRWRDLKTGEVFEGKRWLRGHPAPLDTLPVFVRDGSKAGQ